MIDKKKREQIVKRDLEIVDKINKGYNVNALAVEYGLTYNGIATIKHKYKDRIVK